MGGRLSKKKTHNTIIPVLSTDTAQSLQQVSTEKDEKSDPIKTDPGKTTSSAQKMILPTRLSPNYVAIPNRCRQTNPVSNSSLIKGLIGLKNLGNTCFMNSALQCLLNTPPLVDYFLQGVHFNELNLGNKIGSKGNVALAFARLVKQYWVRNDAQELNPKEFFNVITNYAPIFGQGKQEDAHEFLAYLLDILHEDLNRVKSKSTFANAESDNEHLEDSARESWRNYLTRNKSIIVDLLQGQSKSTLACLQCGYTSHKFEPFMYLSLPIPDAEKTTKISLIDCMKEYSKEEKLEVGEQWFCPRCKALVEGTKKLEIWKLPNILIVNLKRFRYDRKSKGKITTLVDYPIVDLDLTPIAAGIQRDKPIYDLFAVSNHNGTLNKGHYYTFAKNREDNSWYAYNDSEALTLEPNQIVSPTGYMLFFCKTSAQDFKRQSLSRPEAWPHALTKSNAKPIPSPGRLPLGRVISKRVENVIVLNKSERPSIQTSKMTIGSEDFQLSSFASDYGLSAEQIFKKKLGSPQEFSTTTDLSTALSITSTNSTNRYFQSPLLRESSDEANYAPKSDTKDGINLPKSFNTKRGILRQKPNKQSISQRSHSQLKNRATGKATKMQETSLVVKTEENRHVKFENTENSMRNLKIIANKDNLTS